MCLQILAIKTGKPKDVTIRSFLSFSFFIGGGGEETDAFLGDPDR